ncbi:hypothetical protein P43SY_003852 [Pythium insidiosum]|uniref:Putative auto-transporter adhesin head GIN domain-containing protein n=1 Tax=Pythium insidiosum TaxID=114742 RepID=A0AAD5LDR1_PYTIN|nr:hypothetical protein P43SY_003852 [Pythium insidiosum]
MKLAFPALSVALAALAGAHALRIESSEVAPPADIRGEHQELERVWSVFSAEPLEKLHLAVPGPVFVRYDSSLRPVVTPEAAPTRGSAAGSQDDDESVEVSAGSAAGAVKEAGSLGSEVKEAGSLGSDAKEAGSLDEAAQEAGSFEAGSFESDLLANVTSHSRRLRAHKKTQDDDKEDDESDAPEVLVARVVVTGNSSELLNMLELLALKKSSNNGLRFHLQNADATAEGFLLTQVQLAEQHVLRHLTTSLSSVVDVAPRVLVTNSSETKVKLAVQGASGLLVNEPEAITLRDLDVEISGSGFVQLNVSSVQLDGKLNVNLAGSGAIALHTPSINASEIKSSISGAGALVVEAENLTATEIVTAVYGVGVGSLRATTRGAAHKQKITIAGAGNVYAGSVVANRTKVEIWGSGEAYVQVKEKLDVSTAFSGNVFYVGDAPEDVRTSGYFFWRTPVQPAAEDKYETHAAIASPAVYPEHVSVQTKQARHSVDPIVKKISVGAQSVVLSSHLAAVAHGPNALLVFGCVAFGLVAVGMFAQSFQQRRARRHYRPLV